MARLNAGDGTGERNLDQPSGKPDHAAGSCPVRMAALETPVPEEKSSTDKALVEVRGQLFADARASLRSNPENAHMIGVKFKEGISRLYGEKNNAAYESRRGWVAMMWALPTDIAVDRATVLVREHTESGKPLNTLVTSLRAQREFPALSLPETTAFSPYAEFRESLLTVLQGGFDPFWRKYRPGGIGEAFYTEFQQAQELPKPVLRRWHREYISAIIKGEGISPVTDTGATLDSFTTYLKQTGRDGVATNVTDTVEGASRVLAVDYFASYDTPSLQEPDKLRARIPKLAAFASVHRSELQTRLGGFLLELQDLRKQPSLQVLQAEARKALRLAPGDNVTAFDPDMETQGRCVGYPLGAVEKVLELGNVLLPSTLRRPA